MEQHVSGITQLVNHYFGRFALSLLSALHIRPSNPATPIPEHVVMAMLVLVVGTLLGLWVKSRLSVDRPGASQQVAEFLLTNPLGFGINDILEENAGHDWRRYIAMVGSVSLFILLANLFGVFPFLSSPTANATVPLACAVITFLYFNWQGISHHGPLGYLKQFAGPVAWLSPLIFPVELLSTTARLLSLTVRLWANIFASDMIYVLFLGLFAGPAIWGWEKSPVLGVLLGIFPALFPLAFVALHIFVSVVQTYVFTILPAVYIGLATADEH
ncbi:MAG TPA: F0F1 ATP synthase subunit A [Candidatus Dormibacteraeota bacterium]|nr:F0F1 ATP synthase subunit A [Candidatus Dormibacteraeota bacterium]